MKPTRARRVGDARKPAQIGQSSRSAIAVASAISGRYPAKSSAAAAMPKLMAAARARLAWSRISTRANAISS